MNHRRFGTRALSLFLTLALCLTLVPTVALAGESMTAFIFADQGCDYQGEPAIVYNPGTNEVESISFPDGRYFVLDTSGAARFSLSLDIPVSGFQLGSLQSVSLISGAQSYTLYENGASQYGGSFEDPTDPWLQEIVIPSFATGIYLVDVSYAGTTYTDPDAIEFVETGSLKDPPTITTDSLPSGKVGESYSASLSATAKYGGTLTWSVAPGSQLPAGLSLSSSGVLSGTPSAADGYSFALQVSEAGGGSVSKGFYLTIRAQSCRIRFNLNGGTAAPGADYTGRTVNSGSTITLPAAPTMTGYVFMGWKYDDTTYQAGDAYTVTGPVAFTAQWKEKDPVIIGVQDLGQLVGSFWVRGYYGAGTNEYRTLFHDYFREPTACPNSIPLSIWNFAGSHPSYSRLELLTYVDGAETVIASYSGTVQEGSTGITLTKAGPDFAVLKSVAVAGMQEPDDYYRSLIQRNGKTMSFPCLVSTTDNNGYSTSIYGKWSSDKYTVYDWDARDRYQYSFNAANGVLTVTVPMIGDPSVTLSGTVTFSGGTTPVAGVTVQAKQYYKSCWRTATAVTDANGGYAMKIYPEATVYLTLYSGSEELYFNERSYVDNPTGTVSKDITISCSTLRTSVQVQAAAGQEALVDRYLRGQVNTLFASVTITNANDNSKKDKKSYFVHSRVGGDEFTLRNTAAAASVTAELTGDLFAAGDTRTVPITSARGSVTFTPVLKPGVVVNLKSATTFSACLAWYNSDGALLKRSSSFSIGNPGRDFAFVCPGEPGGYTLVLVPNIYSSCLILGSSFDRLPDGAKAAVWTAVMETGKIAELDARSFDRVDGLSATYITKPGSALYASAEGFSGTGEVVAFFGEIGLDPGLKNGRLRTLKIRTGVYSDSAHVWNSAPVQSLVINGKEYMGRLQYHYHTAYYEIYLDSENISLPCQYTIYCNPGTMDYDMDLTVTANVTAVNANSGSQLAGSDQLVGSAVVVRPGAYLDTLSTYVNRDTVRVTGRARPNEDVSIFDNDVAVGGARADKWGEWSADIKLDGVQTTGATTHIITARTASEAESEELWIIHDSAGPQLTGYTMTWTEWQTKTINVGDPYTFYGHQMKDVTFTAVIDKPDKLEVMSEWGDGVKAVTKVYTTDGEIRFVPMTQNGDTFTGTVDTTLRDSVSYAELMYVPQVAMNTQMGANLAETVSAVDTSALSAIKAQAEGVDVKNLTSAANWSVTFDGTTPTLSGNYGELNANEIKQAAEARTAETGARLKSISMTYDTDNSTLAWLNAIADQQIANINAGDPDTLQNIQRYTFSGLFESKTDFDNARKNIQTIAENTHGTEDVMPYQINAGGSCTTYRYIITDAWQEDGALTFWSYFISAMFVEDKTNESAPEYYICMGVEMSKDFCGYLKLPDQPTVTGMVTLQGDGSFVGRVRRFVLAGSESSSSGPMYGWPQERMPTEYHPQGYTGTPRTPDEFHGNFDLNEREQYYQQEAGTEAALGYGALAGGAANVGPTGPIGTALGFANWGHAHTRRERYKHYADDMKRELKEVLPSNPCYQALTEAQQATFAESMHEFDAAYNRYAFSHGFSELTDGVVNLSSFVGGFMSLTGKQAVKLAVGGFLSSTVAGKFNDGGLNDVITAYNKTYKKIDSMCRAVANQTGNSDCKKDQKSKNTKNVRSSDGSSFPNNNDPSGIVYEAVIQNPVEGAKVTLYYAANAGGSIVREGTSVDTETGKKTGTGQVAAGDSVSSLKAAEDVRYLLPQEAVQVTGEDGKYSWGVPEGLWYVTAEYGGMSGNSSGDAAATVKNVTVGGETYDLLPVLPVQLDVNIPLVDRTAPVVEEVLFTDEGIFVTFSKYMVDMAGDNTSVLTAANYSLSDAEGNPVAGFTVESAEQGNAPANIDPAETTYTRTVLLKPDDTFSGDLTLTVAGTVTSYAGTPMGDNYSKTAPVSEPTQLAAPVFGLDSGTTVQRGDTVAITLPSGAPEGTKVYYSTDGSEPTADSKVYDGPVAVTDDMTITAVAVCTGCQTSAPVSASYLIEKPRTAGVSATVTDSGLSVTVVPPYGETFDKGFCAAYDKNGQMLAVQPLTSGGEEQTLTLTCDPARAQTVKAFFLGAGSRPVSRALTWTKGV